MSEADDWSRHWQRYGAAAARNPAQRMRQRYLLAAMAAGPPVGHLVDIGCGQGELLAAAVRLGVALRFTGIEPSEAGVALARAKVPEARFLNCDLVAALPDCPLADLATCCEVLEHVDDDLAFCRRLVALLEPDGRLLVSVPAGPRSAFDLVIGHRRHYSRGSLESLLTRSGLVVEYVVGAGVPFFYLYRLLMVGLGRHVAEKAAAPPNSAWYSPARWAMAAFDLLFRLNLPAGRLGWQLYASARRPGAAPATATAGGNHVGAV